jgi:tetratricopeptide (TPR) repeat protein
MKDSASVIASETPRPWYKRKHVLIDLAIILVVAAIIAVIWWVGHRPKPEPAPSVPQFSGQALVDEVNKKYSSNDYGGAVKLLKGQKSINETGTQLLLANAYANQGDKAAALKVYDKLQDENKLVAESAAAAALLAEQLNDNAKALAYYKIAVEKLKTDNNQAISDHLPMYEAKVDELTKKVSQ